MADRPKRSSMRPVLVVRRAPRKHAAAHGGGAWKVAYADFATTMMALFLVMWLMSMGDAVRKRVAGYFRDPGVFDAKNGSASPIPMGPGESKQESPQPSQGGQPPGTIAGQVRDSLGIEELRELQLRKQREARDGDGEARRMQMLARDLEKRVAELAKRDETLRQLMDTVSLRITNEGLRIELAESSEMAFFGVGTANPQRTMVDVLAALAPRLAQLGNRIAVEGHTDSRAYPPGATYGNWELSADRANAARKILVEHGIPERQVEGVTGFADRRLRKPDAPHDIANRRVSIIVRWPEE